MARKHWLLKVVAGPHQGAEMRLTEGQALVGKDDDCDVVLHDVLVAPQHFALELSDAGITVAPLGGRVYAGGKRIKEAKEKVASFSFITLGGTHLVIGPAEEKWPLLSPADVPQLEPDQPDPPAETQTAGQAAPAPSAEPPITPSPAKSPAPPPPPSRKGPLLGIAAGVLLLAGWFVFWQMVVNDHAKHSKGADTDLARAMRVIQAAGLEGKIKVEDQSGRLLASGYVDTEIQQRQVQTALRDEVPTIVPKIWSLDKMVSNARIKLNEQRLPLDVTALPDGKLKVSGQLSTSQASLWQSAKQGLLTDIPGLTGVVEDLQEIRPAATPSSRGTPGRVVVVTGGNGATPNAAPSPFSDPGAAPEAEPAKEPDPRIAFIKSRKDGLNWLRLDSGELFFKGAKLPNGGVIKEITSNSVKIADPDGLREVRSGGMLWEAKSADSRVQEAQPPKKRNPGLTISQP